ncbi:serine hydrolase [Mesorhizobium sp. CAU 1741]|uniref:serine hydrolase domain-containing protein n=1 Tax=Mesorhizobium sp. CAU 1741 TaxID=3140366 RepID=UPI00325A4565
MRLAGTILKWMAATLVGLILGVSIWLYATPPALIRVGTGYSAKIVCSSHFVSGRDAGEALAVDVQAPGHPLLGYIDVDVDADTGMVSASLLGLFGENRAVYREGAGCTSLPAGGEPSVLPAAASVATSNADESWPAGERVDPSRDAALTAILDDAELTGPGMRAVVVVKDGRIIGERYGDGFSADTPLLGWSMTKTVTAAIIGTLVRDGRLSVDQDELFEDWLADGRAEITIADLMAMSSGLEFNEDYGDVTDVTRMLYLEPDMAGFAADKPLVGAVGERFSYSSGTTLLLSRIWQNAFSAPADAYSYPREAIFTPLGMTSAVMETDAAGTFTGSSYLYATARDWARFGEFLRNDGVWDGRQILPDGYVDWMREAAPASDGAYGRGQLWLQQTGTGNDSRVPADTFWLRGHDGQSVAVVPSQGLVVVRMGLTPSKLAYSSQPLIGALAEALR